MSDLLRYKISQIADWQTKDAATLLAELTADNYVAKPEGERMWSIAGIAKEFGITASEAVYGALVAAGMNGIAARFASVGLDTTDPQWLANADALIAGGELDSLDAETQQGIKWIGHTNTAWTEPLTEAEVATAKSQLENRIAIEAMWADIQSNYVLPALADPDSIEADVRSAIKASL